jgi:hypothetical protein
MILASTRINTGNLGIFAKPVQNVPKRSDQPHKAIHSNDDTISYSSTPSLTMGLPTIDTSSEENYLPSSTTVHNTEFQCFMDGCIFRGTPRDWLESKHREQLHEASSKPCLPVTERQPKSSNLYVPITSEVLNSEFQYLGNSYSSRGTPTEYGSSYHRQNKHELPRAEVNDLPSREASPFVPKLYSQNTPESKETGTYQPSPDLVQHREIKTNLCDSEGRNQTPSAEIQT